MPRTVTLGSTGVAALLMSASHVLQRLPSQVAEEQRGALVKALASANDLVVEVHTKPAVILVRDGSRALVKIPARQE